MNVNINEINSIVRTVDGDALLSPTTMRKIVQAVLEAVRADEAHRERVRAEQEVSRNVRDAYRPSGR